MAKTIITAALTGAVTPAGYKICLLYTSDAADEL